MVLPALDKLQTLLDKLRRLRLPHYHILGVAQALVDRLVLQEMLALMLWLFLVMVVEQVLEAQEELVVLKVLPLELQAVQEVQQA